MGELYENLYGANVTLPNEFLNQYLADTDPVYIKVFLFYIWKGIKNKYSIEETSIEIDLEASKVEMALRFWVKKKILKSDCLIHSCLESKTENSKTDNSKAGNIIVADIQNKKIKNKKDYAEIEKEILFVAEKLLKQTVSESQELLISKCYNEYDFSVGLIEYLLEYCSDCGKTNARYMSKVAESWYEQGIKDADGAKKFTESIDKRKTKTSKKSNQNIVSSVDYDKDFNDRQAMGNF